MTEETGETEPKTDRPKGMRPWVFCLRAVFVISLLPLVFAVAAAVMIIDRDITAPSWIIERIEERAGVVLEGATLEFGSITVRIGRDLHPTVRLVDTRLIDAGGPPSTNNFCRFQRFRFALQNRNRSPACLKPRIHFETIFQSVSKGCT